MNSSKVLYPIFWIVIGVILTLFFIRGCQKEVLEYWEVGGFKTDTVLIDKPITIKEIIIDTFRITIPPKVVTKYKLLPTQYVEVACDDDSLITLLDSLGNELSKINKAFVLIAPTSSKIISGLFTKKDLSLTLLNTQGELYNLEYLVNYDKFKYQYLDNKIKVEAIPENNTLLNISDKSFKFDHGIYLSPGYSILDNKFTGSLDYLIKYGRIRGLIEGRISIEENPVFNLHTKIGFKIK